MRIRKQRSRTNRIEHHWQQQIGGANLQAASLVQAASPVQAASHSTHRCRNPLKVKLALEQVVYRSSTYMQPTGQWPLVPAAAAPGREGGSGSAVSSWLHQHSSLSVANQQRMTDRSLRLNLANLKQQQQQ